MTDNHLTIKSKEQQSGVPSTELDAILSSIPDIIIRFTLDGNIVWWNKNFKDIITHSSKELLDTSFIELFIPCDTNDADSIFSKTQTNGQSEIDAFITTIDGKKRYHLKSTLIGDLSNKEVLVVGRDINERIELNDSLKQNQEQLQTLIDTLPFLVFLTTIDDEYLLANKKFCDFVGMSKSNIIGHKSEMIFSQDIHEYFTRNNDKVLLDKRSIHYDSSLDISRSNYSLSVEKFPLFDDENNIYAICGVIEDVTAQYQLQKQLQQTQKMEAIGQLTGGIAHDFNNVLASIMGYTGLTKRRAAKYEDETIFGYLSQITKAGERARDLVQQLLAFSRGDVGGLQVLSPEPLAKEAISMLSSLIPSSINLNLKIRNNNLKHYIEVDPVQFNQSIMNLVINAKDSIVDETGIIDVSLEYLPHVRGICDSCHTAFTGKYIQLSVSDSGVGICNEILGRIFDPFFTTKDVGKGSGMGLSMLHGIVHSSGGHIAVKSKNIGDNKGTVIKVFFPEVKSNNVEEQKGVYSLNKTNNKSNGESILIIDDEPLITNYLTDLLSDEGYKIISFNDPILGLKYFNDNKEKLDIIITDQTMPKLTGIELSKSIMLSGYKIPIILCSGYSDFVNDSDNSDVGVDIFMNKPFDDNTLLENLTKLLAKYSLLSA